MTDTEQQIKKIRERAALAGLANDWQQKACECDPETGNAPCRMCAIESSLKDIPWLLEQNDLLRKRVKELEEKQ